MGYSGDVTNQLTWQSLPLGLSRVSIDLQAFLYFLVNVNRLGTFLTKHKLLLKVFAKLFIVVCICLMEIFTLCWISRSPGLILPLLGKGCILSLFITLTDPWKFRVRAEAPCRQREMLQKVWVVLKTNYWKCQGPALKGPAWWGGTSQAHGSKHGCVTSGHAEKEKFIRDRLLLSLKEN